MTKEEKDIIFNRLFELEEQHPAFAESVRDNAYCEAIADVKLIIEGIKEPYLPSTLDEAAFQSADENAECLFLEEWEKAFKAGVEWMASQGVTIYRTVDDFGDGASIKPPTEIELYSSGAQLGDKVIVQIRKKE